MNINTIKALVSLLKASGLSALEIEENGSKIRLENMLSGQNLNLSGSNSAEQFDTMDLSFDLNQAEADTKKTPEKLAESATSKDSEEDYDIIIAPMVGVYCSLSKMGKNTLKDGDKIESGSIVCGIEAMKIICEIKSEINGIFKEELVKDGDQVEFGQPLIKIKKN
jgi:Biotin carboxyl carrier protein